MTVIGHRQVVSILENDLPAVTLLTGPDSVGKWTLAEHLANHHRVLEVDQLTYPEKITADRVRAAIGFVNKAPFGTFKLVTMRLDGAHEASLNALLKTLEEPPPTARFILVTAAPTLPTIVSRAQVFRLGTLSPDELCDVLVQVVGMTPAAAVRAASHGRGQVARALMYTTLSERKPAVLNVVRALASGDRELFDKSFKGWDADTKELFMIWIGETLTGRWDLFTEAETYGFHRDRVRVQRMLLAICQYPDARARLGVRAALEPFLTRR